VIIDLFPFTEILVVNQKLKIPGNYAI